LQQQNQDDSFRSDEDLRDFRMEGDEFREIVPEKINNNNKFN
jgi:hypothetical protein